MRKVLLLVAAVVLVSANAFASYYVVLKNGTTYKAKAKWTVSGGKALVKLESGQTLQLDPNLIDEAKSEQVTRSGLGDAKIISLGTGAPPEPEKPQQSSLGASVKLRKLPTDTPKGVQSVAAPTVPAPVQQTGILSNEVVEKFGRAYENVGLFEQKVTASAPRTLHVELTADSEDKVFNAISATSFLMVRNAGVPGAQIDMVELFMKTTNGGSSGRFQMNREDATSIDQKKITQQEYFVRKVIF